MGKGSYGVVYKGYRLSTNQVIAAKFVSNKKLALNDNCSREIEVMETLSEINHKNIMGYYGKEKK